MRSNQKAKARRTKRKGNVVYVPYEVPETYSTLTPDQYIEVQPPAESWRLLKDTLIDSWSTRPWATFKHWLFLIWDISFKLIMWSNAYTGLLRLTYLYSIWYLRGGHPDQKPKDPISSIMDGFALRVCETARSNFDPFNLNITIRFKGSKKPVGRARHWCTGFLIIITLSLGMSWIWSTEYIGGLIKTNMSVLISESSKLLTSDQEKS